MIVFIRVFSNQSGDIRPATGAADLQTGPKIYAHKVATGRSRDGGYLPKRSGGHRSTHHHGDWISNWEPGASVPSWQEGVSHTAKSAS
ncbi:hypothetical protein DR64_5358 [Paraburkholderia xenovorans LB400]|jgi:hypothetical protein|nr:hypothetical protein DR64_5358 [Paraburkholderia xenovorans LB400]